MKKIIFIAAVMLVTAFASTKVYYCPIDDYCQLVYTGEQVFKGYKTFGKYRCSCCSRYFLIPIE